MSKTKTTPFIKKQISSDEQLIDHLQKTVATLKKKISTAHFQQHRHVHINDKSDSFEVGTPAKGGTIKVYHNALDVAGFKQKFDNMLEVRKYAKAQIEVAFPHTKPR